MDLLDELFPGIEDLEDEGVPVWKDRSRPWSIISEKAELISQIKSKTEDSDGIFIHEDAIIGDFVRIEGPSFIGPGSEIRHGAYIRKGSWICGGAVVGHASEIKGSILLPGSKAPHFNYVGDSIIGIGTNLGAGVITANMRNDKKNIFLGSPKYRIDSGTNKMGAIVGNDVSIGCNSVLNPGSIVYPGLAFPPLTVISGEVKTSKGKGSI
jgi:NDP-sugar pyrophosphorylase family protein